jgi:hypothetical protein
MAYEHGYLLLTKRSSATQALVKATGTTERREQWKGGVGSAALEVPACAAGGTANMIAAASSPWVSGHPVCIHHFTRCIPEGRFWFYAGIACKAPQYREPPHNAAPSKDLDWCVKVFGAAT